MHSSEQPVAPPLPRRTRIFRRTRLALVLALFVSCVFALLPWVGGGGMEIPLNGVILHSLHERRSNNIAWRGRDALYGVALEPLRLLGDYFPGIYYRDEGHARVQPFYVSVFWGFAAAYCAHGIYVLGRLCRDLNVPTRPFQFRSRTVLATIAITGVAFFALRPLVAHQLVTIEFAIQVRDNGKRLAPGAPILSQVFEHSNFSNAWVGRRTADGLELTLSSVYHDPTTEESLEGKTILLTDKPVEFLVIFDNNMSIFETLRLIPN
jgi:hypothetical protein